MTILLTLLVLTTLIYKMLRNPKRKLFPLYVAISGMIFFMFGFQVHEKAMMMMLTVL